MWACERLHMYLYGHNFELLTNHKPLGYIYSHRLKLSARIERWVLRLQLYSFVVKHKSGKQSIAESLARLLQFSTQEEEINSKDHYIRYLAKRTTPRAIISTHDIE